MTDQHDDLSLEGKGWDILTGGEENPFADSTFDDAETDAILTETSEAPDLSPADLEGSFLPDLEPDDLPNLSPSDLAGPLTDEMRVEPEAEPEMVETPTVTESPTEDDAIANLFDELSDVREEAPPEDLLSVPEVPGSEEREAVVVEQSHVESREGSVSTSRVSAGPADMVEDTSTPERAPTEDLEPDDELAMLFLTNERIKELWYDINDLYDIVVNDVRGHFDETEAIIDDLKRARELLLADREHFDNAEEIVMDVKAKLRLQVKVRHWNRTHVPWVGIYLFTWLAGLLAFSLFVPTIQEAATGQFNLPGYLSATILPSVWGGFGAVFGAMWALIDHSAIKRDFDPIHVTWFYLNPIMGLAIGVLTYAVILGSGILGATLVTGGAETEMFSRAVEGGSRVGLEQLILYGVCAIVGFKQNIFWQLIQQTLKTILPGSASNLVTTSGTGPYSDK